MATATATAPAREDVEERNAVLVRFMPLVRYVAKRVADSYGLPAGVETSDLVSYGVFGLLEAYERFDEGRGVKFETFAVPRIRGAILDELRHMDWVPRNVRTRARKLSDAATALTGTLGRAPTRDEIAAALGVEELDRFESKGTPATLLALEDLGSQDAFGEPVAVGDTIVDTSAEEPGAALEREELCELLGRALDELSERDRLILTLYYFENIPLAELAKVLNVTESRVSQLHTRALHALRDRIDAA